MDIATMLENRTTRWTVAQLLLTLRCLEQDLGHPVRTRDLDAAHRSDPDRVASRKVYVTRFGTVAAAMAMARRAP